MHSHIGAWEEANVIHVEPAGITRRSAERSAKGHGPLVVYDLGMGIAANAIAAIEAARGPIHLISFEKHLEGIRLALAHSSKFPWIARHEDRIESLLDHRAWAGDDLRWDLREGEFDARALAGLPPADAILFDFYSPKTDPALWDREVFASLLAAASPEAVLTTYSASKTTRAAMLDAGWYVGVGSPTEAKSETTVAARRKQDLDRPLGPAWLASLERSSMTLPIGRIRLHPQFSGDLIGA